jgi:glycosyltransferase involved in cell wall biosynthesis
MSEQLALFIGDLSIGGAERVVINLSKGFTDCGHDVDIVLVRKSGDLLEEVPESVNVVNLGVDRMRWSIPALVRYLNTIQPRAIISFMTSANTMAVLANRISGNPSVTIATEHNTQSMKESLKPTIIRSVARFVYPLADHIVGVSAGVTEDVVNWSLVERGKVQTIYNPVIEVSSTEKKYVKPDHPWYGNDDVDVIFSAGRHVEQKDFETLLEAFAKLSRSREARLILAGEGNRTEEYRNLADDLGVSDQVSMPGLVDCIYRYMHHSDVFALSSRWEGLSLVLIEAMGCGTPVVSTDCPSGPAEVLESGKYGPLVPVGSETELSKAIIERLENPISSEKLRDRARDFSIESATESYLSLLTNEST